jgi:outer membrane assembly lipoprotein YfiO
MLRTRLLLVALCCGVLLTACHRKSNLPAPGSVDADKYLFDHGSASLQRKRWVEGREYFKKLVDTYPQSPYRQDAKLGIGDSYLGENTIESNILAVNEFREFLSFFPGNPRTDYAQYKIAVAYSNQMLGPERDPTPAQDALNSCDVFARNYPSSQYRSQVDQVKRRAKDQLSGQVCTTTGSSGTRGRSSGSRGCLPPTRNSPAATPSISIWVRCTAC